MNLNKLLLGIVVLSFLSCNQATKNKNNNLAVSKITIIDSLKINFPSGAVADVSNNNILFYNYISSDIGVFNMETKKIKTFNKFGSAVGEFNSMLNSHYLRFINDTLIGVSEVNGVKIYSFDGKWIKDIKVKNENTHASLSNFEFVNDSIFFAIRTLQGNPSIKSFYNQDHNLIVKQNLENNAQSLFGKFPLPNSDLIHNDFYYPYPFDFYTHFDNETLEYSLLNSNDSRIYTFNILTEKIVKQTALSLSYYNRLEKPFATTNSAIRSSQESIMDIYMNAIIYGYFKTKKYDYIVYSEAKEKDEVIEYLNNNAIGSLNANPITINIRIQVLENGKKTVDDILVPEQLTIPVYFFPNENKGIFASKTLSKGDDLNGITTLYICKLGKDAESE